VVRVVLALTGPRGRACRNLSLQASPGEFAGPDGEPSAGARKGGAPRGHRTTTRIASGQRMFTVLVPPRWAQNRPYSPGATARSGRVSRRSRLLAILPRPHAREARRPPAHHSPFARRAEQGVDPASAHATGAPHTCTRRGRHGQPGVDPGRAARSRARCGVAFRSRRPGPVGQARTSSSKQPLRGRVTRSRSAGRYAGRSAPACHPLHRRYLGAGPIELGDAAQRPVRRRLLGLQTSLAQVESAGRCPVTKSGRQQRAPALPSRPAVSPLPAPRVRPPPPRPAPRRHRRIPPGAAPANAPSESRARRVPADDEHSCASVTSTAGRSVAAAR